ncbi:polymer-forming cytoskeletal protein [Natronospirillum operosum]|uniref:Polymer-forming cytoskeletal protein n=1 Tax=Natronospirillum operosum TaxID=2759953 RepID=A0A4Z0WCJ3_9GAMM|nr:polymer-forming cytoskeletal protein [Natronospirillum operosum]TGG91385.1 polymer-forming cytoskeletal protein [Natronospirillum operosum]
MFGSDKKVGNFDTTLISAKAEVVGDIKLTGGLHIDGQVTGNILAEPGSGAVVRVSDKGVVKGEIRAPHVIINGKVSGDVTSFEHVELAKKAEVNGDLYYATMEMVMGARVNGRLLHQQEDKGSAKRKLARFGSDDKTPAAGDSPTPKTSETASDESKNKPGVGSSTERSAMATGTEGTPGSVKINN